MTDDKNDHGERIATLETHLIYIKDAVDDINKKLDALRWKVASISGTTGAIIALVTQFVVK